MTDVELMAAKRGDLGEMGDSQPYLEELGHSLASLAKRLVQPGVSENETPFDQATNKSGVQILQ